MDNLVIYTNLAAIITMILLAGVGYLLTKRNLWLLFILFGGLYLLVGTAMQTLAVYLAFGSWDYQLGLAIANKASFIVVCCAMCSCAVHGPVGVDVLPKASFLFALATTVLILICLGFVFELNAEGLQEVVSMDKTKVLDSEAWEVVFSMGFYAQLMALVYWYSIRKRRRKALAAQVQA